MGVVLGVIVGLIIGAVLGFIFGIIATCWAETEKAKTHTLVYDSESESIRWVPNRWMPEDDKPKRPESIPTESSIG